MNLSEQVLRLKKLMFESQDDFPISASGNINSPYGMEVFINNQNNSKIAKTCIIDFNNGMSLSSSLNGFMKDKNEDFSKDVYFFGADVNQNYKRMGLGTKLMNECKNLCLLENYQKAYTIINKKNDASNGMVSKLGYKLIDESPDELLYILTF